MHPYQKMIQEKLKAAEKAKHYIVRQRCSGKSHFPPAIPIGGTVLLYSTKVRPNNFPEIFINEWSEEK